MKIDLSKKNRDKWMLSYYFLCKTMMKAKRRKKDSYK